MISINVLDVKLQRFLVGLIAFTMPPIVTFLANNPLPSISDSYYTNARDEFVGMLFIVGTFLIAYNGKTTLQASMSKIAAVCAWIIALFPTAKNSDGGFLSVHYVAATAFFSILVYFCYVFFQASKTKDGRAPVRRKKMYAVCGIIMVLCMAAIFISKIANVSDSWHITFWGETIALEAFGCAWIVAGRWRGLRYFVGKDEDAFKFSESLRTVPD